jgi:MoxR-like ATPase
MDVTNEESKINKTAEDYLKEFINYADSFKVFSEREHEVEALKFAFLCKEHLLFKGSAGTAKSMLAMKFLSGIEGLKLFKQQFTAFMDESYVFGQQLIEELKKGIVKHNLKNSLADAEGAFLDEFFNANEEMIISCNEILNERTFTRNGQQEKCPLISAILTTNQEREAEKKLIPIYDRILFTVKVMRVAEENNRIEMYKNSMTGVFNNFKSFSIGKLYLIHKYIENSKIEFSEGILMLLDKLLKDFQEQSGLYISDRKVIKSLKFLKVIALLNFRDHILVDDLMKLKYTWTTINEPVVESVFDACYIKIKEEYLKIEKSMGAIEEVEEIYKKILEKSKTAVSYKDFKEVKNYISKFIDNVLEFKNSQFDAKIKRAYEIREAVKEKLKEFRKAGVVEDDELDAENFEWLKKLKKDTDNNDLSYKFPHTDENTDEKKSMLKDDFNIEDIIL